MAFEVETRIITAQEKGDGHLTLAYTPLVPDVVSVDPEGGPAQEYNRDYFVNGTTLYWDDHSIPDSDIKSVIDEGYTVTLRIMYERA